MSAPPTNDLDVYRSQVRELACPLCGAQANEPCQSMDSPANEDAPVAYVHDDRSAAHHQARVAAAFDVGDRLTAAQLALDNTKAECAAHQAVIEAATPVFTEFDHGTVSIETAMDQLRKALKIPPKAQA